MTMKRLLGPSLLALSLVLAGCADDASSDVGEDPAPTATTSPTSSLPTPTKPTGAVEYEEIALISQTAAGGTVDPNAVRLDDLDARESFLGQFDMRGFGNKIERKIAATTVPEGYLLLGAVVSIGCDVPPGVSVATDSDGWVITPQKVASPLQECFAPVTTVALVAVPG
jgi:predicted small secreted protein